MYHRRGAICIVINNDNVVNANDTDTDDNENEDDDDDGDDDDDDDGDGDEDGDADCDDDNGKEKDVRRQRLEDDKDLNVIIRGDNGKNLCLECGRRGIVHFDVVNSSDLGQTNNEPNEPNFAKLTHTQRSDNIFKNYWQHFKLYGFRNNRHGRRRTFVNNDNSSKCGEG